MSKCSNVHICHMASACVTCNGGQGYLESNAIMVTTNISRLSAAKHPNTTSIKDVYSKRLKQVWDNKITQQQKVGH